MDRPTAAAFGTTVEFWMKLQKDWQFVVAGDRGDGDAVE
jgi:plasmid maintenance system antidote protein VapI